MLPQDPVRVCLGKYVPMDKMSAAYAEMCSVLDRVKPPPEHGKRAYHPRDYSDGRVYIAGWTVWRAVGSHFKSGLEFTYKDAADWVADVGFKPQGASTAVSNLVADGFVESLGQGRYRFIRALHAGYSYKRQNH